MNGSVPPVLDGPAPEGVPPPPRLPEWQSDPWAQESESANAVDYSTSAQTMTAAKTTIPFTSISSLESVNHLSPTHGKPILVPDSNPGRTSALTYPPKG